MTTIKIVMRVPDEYADPDHDTGLTQKGYDMVMDGISWEIVDEPELVDP